MRESRSSGSVRGAVSNGRPYRDSHFRDGPSCRNQSWMIRTSVFFWSRQPKGQRETRCGQLQLPDLFPLAILTRRKAIQAILQ